MKKIRKILMFMLMTILTLSIMSVSAEAATLKKYTAGKTYKNSDFTGDGKADKFCYKNLGNNQVRIYINGKNKGTYSLGKAAKATVYRWRVNNSNNYLIIQGASTGGTWYDVYRCTKSKLVYAYSFDGKHNLTNEKLYKISGTSLYVKTSSGKWGTFSGRNGSKGLTVRFQYKTKSGKISLASRYGTVIGEKTFKAGNSFTTSSGLGKTNTKGVYVKKGATVKLLKAYYGKKGAMWYKVSVNGKTGWFEDSDSKMLL